MIRGLIIILFLLSIAALSRANGLNLKGEQFLSRAAIRWEGPIALPASLVVYEATPQKFDSTIISNAMKIGGFKLLNKVTSPKGTLLFRDKKDIKFMTRFLEIVPEAGKIKYYDRGAEGMPVKNVPSFEGAESLAVSYLQKLGIEPNQIVGKPWPRSQTETSALGTKDGSVINKVVTMRGIFLLRQVNGIQVVGNYFLINFCNDAKPSMFELRWPKLKAVKEYPIATKQEIIGFIKGGRAVDPNPDCVPLHTNEIVIQKASLHYLDGESDGQKAVYPFIELEATSDNHSFKLHCPALRTSP